MLRSAAVNQCDPFLNDVQPMPQFILIYDQWRADPEHIESAECIHVLAFQISRKLRHFRAIAIKRRQGFARNLVFHEFNHAKESFVSNVSDAIKLLLHGLEALAEITSLALDIRK